MEKIQNLIKAFGSTKSRETYNEIIENIKNQEKLWIAFSPVTKNYYLDYIQGVPSSFVFSEKEYAEKFADYILQQNVKIDIAELNVSERKAAFGDFYRSGIENIAVDNGQTFLIMSLFDIIEKPDYSKLSKENRPVLNPQLVCASNRFFQALSAKKATRDFEYNMLVQIYHGKYLVPIINGETPVIAAVTRKDGKKVIPIFTDWNEMYKYDTQKKFVGGTAIFDDIEGFCKDGNIVSINPLGFNMMIDSKTVDIIRSIAKDSDKTDVTNQIVIFPLELYPEKMIQVLSKYFSKYDGVNSAYICGMRRGHNKGYVIIVDFEGSKNAIFGGIANEIKPFSEGISVDFLKYDSELGKSAAQKAKKFYQKIKLDI